MHRSPTVISCGERYVWRRSSLDGTRQVSKACCSADVRFDIVSSLYSTKPIVITLVSMTICKSRLTCDWSVTRHDLTSLKLNEISGPVILAASDLA
jgi:hypothetical protein